MKNKGIILTVLFTGFMAFAVFSLKSFFTPYVSFDKAIQSGEYVQVLGLIDKTQKPQYFNNSFSFTLSDEKGNLMKVLYHGQVPLNFEHAEKAVTIGSYNSQNKCFEADKLLVKCPSKYTRERKN